MCTLIAIHRSVPGFPLIVAANRDEYLDRESDGPRLRRLGRGWAMAPLDLRAGGSWLGLSSGGVFTALTNIRNPHPDPTRKSRGQVVMDGLEAPSAAEAADLYSQLAPSTYNPFNCFVADAREAFLVVYDEVPRIRELTPGLHVIGNTEADAPANPKVERIQRNARAALEGAAKQIARRSGPWTPEPILGALGAVCREHVEGGEPLSDTCVHAMGTYGTRSSLLLAIGAVAERSRLFHSDGPPCENEYRDLTALLDELRQAPGYEPTEKPEGNKR